MSCGGDITVLELVKKYISQKTGVRHNTEDNGAFRYRGYTEHIHSFRLWGYRKRDERGM